MSTLIKFITASVVSLLAMSCINGNNLIGGVKGNGNVQSVERDINGNFDAIEVSRGLDVYLTQGDAVSLKVQADENLHDIIMTEVENNVLKIYAEDNITRSSAQKVILSFTEINRIASHSGSDVYGTNRFVLDDIELTSTSGSDMELDIEADVIECSANSGSDMRLSGKASKLYATATSGSDIKAGNLKVRISEVKANSGADITVHASEELIAKANSGGDVKYYGNPEKVTKRDGVSGSVRKQ